MVWENSVALADNFSDSLSFSSSFWESSLLLCNFTCCNSLMNQNTDAYNNTAMTNKLIKCIDFVRNINTNKDIINNMNEACVAVINAGVVPGVKTDSHNSTKNDMFRSKKSSLWNAWIVKDFYSKKMDDYNAFFFTTGYLMLNHTRLHVENFFFLRFLYILKSFFNF